MMNKKTAVTITTIIYIITVTDSDAINLITFH